MELTSEMAAEIKAHALEAYPQEACGLIVAGRYRHYKNVARDPETGFRITPSATASAIKRGVLEAVVHSHPDGPDCPSSFDMRQQEATAVPWVIVATDGTNCGEVFAFGDQVPRLPLIGRAFRHGLNDCYSLIRDYYREELSIDLPDQPRDWEWWLTDEDLYRRHFEEAGFDRISADEAKPGDVFLAQIGRTNGPNHGGVLLGRGLILHHISSRKPFDASRLSAREPMARWSPFITHWLRHRDNHR